MPRPLHVGRMKMPDEANRHNQSTASRTLPKDREAAMSRAQAEADTTYSAYLPYGLGSAATTATDAADGTGITP